MKRAIIFANGSMVQPPALVHSLRPEDLIIAADGGTHHCQALGITPGIIIGDFDSLESQEVLAFKQAGVETIQFSSHKDETDLELALQLTSRREIKEVYVIGALGARWDMTIANILLIAHPRFSNLKIHLLDGRQEFILLRSNDQVELDGRTGDPISLIPLAGDVHGITTDGLEYPLNEEILYFGSPRGVSNVLVKDHLRIKLRHGLLLCIYNPVNS